MFTFPYVKKGLTCSSLLGSCTLIQLCPRYKQLRPRLDNVSDSVRSSSSSSSLRCSSIMVAGRHAVPRPNKGGRRSLMKELRARAHIASRCATMLLCWRIHGAD
ncbi:hypothetical protein C4D60_Mb06t36660 [Musa balbisiana]|uniref:Uncharacterized protein n=1 Tax=Musa balbisiana TaxID=52838 RepID=A0A4S8IT85_MUSBA|nr:hypothetical protein C4D60_Mb06t36660 [Musa balbisiana]